MGKNNTKTLKPTAARELIVTFYVEEGFSPQFAQQKTDPLTIKLVQRAFERGEKESLNKLELASA